VDRHRLPTLFQLDIGLARDVAVRRAVLTFSADAFNVLNRGTTLQVSRDVELPAFSRAREILRPRILRLGVRCTF
jgi:hypothetical protein